MPVMDKTKKREWAGRLAIVLIWGVLIVLCFVFRDKISVEGIVELAGVNKRFVVPILLLVFAVKSVTIVLYLGILYVASGLLLPLPWALAVNVLGTLITAVIPYAVGRKAGEPIVERLIEKHPKLDDVRRYNEGNGFLVTMMLRLITVLPSDPISIYLGALKTGLWVYLAGSVVGYLPDIIIFTVVGKSVLKPRSPQFITAAVIKLALLIMSLIAAGFLRRKVQKKRDAQS